MLEITKVVRDGTKTIVIPLMTPGRLRGSIILRNVCPEFAPRSLAAFTISLSIFINTLYIGSTIKGRKLYTIPSIIALGVLIIFNIGRLKNLSTVLIMPVLSRIFCHAIVLNRKFIHIGSIIIITIKLLLFIFDLLSIMAKG
jgi:hypothetical protein